MIATRSRLLRSLAVVLVCAGALGAAARPDDRTPGACLYAVAANLETRAVSVGYLPEPCAPTAGDTTVVRVLTVRLAPGTAGLVVQSRVDEDGRPVLVPILARPRSPVLRAD